MVYKVKSIDERTENQISHMLIVNFVNNKLRNGNKYPRTVAWSEFSSRGAGGWGSMFNVKRDIFVKRSSLVQLRRLDLIYALRHSRVVFETERVAKSVNKVYRSLKLTKSRLSSL